MRRAALIAILLAACATPSGAEPETCDDAWADVDPVIVVTDGGEPEPVAIECLAEIDERRIRIGFRMPPGPDCYRLSGIGLVESADAVEVTLEVTRSADPLAGACPETPGRSMTEVDLASPVDDRRLLDGSR